MFSVIAKRELAGKCKFPFCYNHFNMSANLNKFPELPFFSNLSHETLAFIEKNSTIQCYSNNEIIQLEGEPCLWAAFVISGSVQVYHLAKEGREQILITLLPGAHFNTVPAVDSNCNHRASARSLGKTKLLTISIEKYRLLLKTRADLAYHVLTDFAHRLDHLTVLVERLSLHSIRGRLASFLIDQADSRDQHNLWTQDEIASHLGTVRDVVGRTLRSFMDAGLIRREGSKFVLLDRAALEEETQF